MDAALEELVRHEVARCLGSRTRIRGLEVVHAADTSTVLVATLARPPHRLVVKVAERDSRSGTEFERTAAVVLLARAAGVPTPEVLSVDTLGQGGPWQCLVQEHVPGLPWRQARPLLEEGEVEEAHREIAGAVSALQAIRLDGYGELERSGRPGGVWVLGRLTRRR